MFFSLPACLGYRIYGGDALDTLRILHGPLFQSMCLLRMPAALHPNVDIVKVLVSWTFAKNVLDAWKKTVLEFDCLIYLWKVRHPSNSSLFLGCPFWGMI